MMAPRVWVEEQEEGWGPHWVELRQECRSDLEVTFCHSLHLAWLWSCLCHQGVENGGRPSIESDRAEGPASMTKAVLAGKHGVHRRRTVRTVSNTAENREVCLLDKGLAFPHCSGHSQPSAPSYNFWWACRGSRAFFIYLGVQETSFPGV